MVRPRKDHCGVDLISDVLRFGRLWYDTPDTAIGYRAGICLMCAVSTGITCIVLGEQPPLTPRRMWEAVHYYSCSVLVWRTKCARECNRLRDAQQPFTYA